MTTPFFRFEHAEGESTLWIHGEICFLPGQAAAFADGMARARGSRLVVRVNSPGGSVSDGLGIYAMLRAHDAAREFIVDGIAASMASVIITAGGPVTIAENAAIFVHCPLYPVVVDANATALRDYAADLDALRMRLVHCYSVKTGADAATIGKWMDDETLFDAPAAVAAKLADAIGKAAPIASAVAFAAHFPRLAALNQTNQPTDKMTPEELQKMEALAAQVAALTETVTKLAAKLDTPEADPEDIAKAKAEADAAEKAKIEEAVAAASAPILAQIAELKSKIPASSAHKPGAVASEWRTEWASEKDPIKKAAIWRKNNA